MAQTKKSDSTANQVLYILVIIILFILFIYLNTGLHVVVSFPP